MNHCRCCGIFMPYIPQFDQSLGTVCHECYGFLKVAEIALAEAGVVGTRTEKPQQKGSKP